MDCEKFTKKHVRVIDLANFSTQSPAEQEVDENDGPEEEQILTEASKVFAEELDHESAQETSVPTKECLLIGRNLSFSQSQLVLYTCLRNF